MSWTDDLGRRPARRELALPVFGVLIAIAFVALMWSRWDASAFLAWKREASPLLFFLAMALLPLIGIPMTPFFVLAGATFSVSLGLLGSAAALALNLGLSFWLARSSLRPALEGILGKTRFSLPELDEAPTRAFRFTLLMKLTPGVPASVKHFVIALAGVPFATYFLVSFAVTGLYGASFIVLGESLSEHDIVKAGVAGAALVVLAIAVLWWQRRGREGDAESSRRAASVHGEGDHA